MRLKLFIIFLFFGTPMSLMAETINVYSDQPSLYNTTSFKDFKSLVAQTDNLIKPSDKPVSRGVMFTQSNDIALYSFSIHADDTLISVAYRDKIGLENSIYYILQRWGFYFLGVSDQWVEVPEQLNYFEENALKQPDIPMITFFGTGGFGVYKTQKGLFQNYKRRNSLSNNIRIGHGYNDFYTKKKSEIDRLQRKGVTIFNDFKGAKKDINENSEEALQLIKEYYEEKYLSGQKVLTISPKDGTSKQGQNSERTFVNNTISKYLWIGNEVAKYLNDKYKDEELWFGYYAYGTGKGQLTPPKFALEKNIIIQVIPYAFQKDFKNTMLTQADEQAFDNWRNKYPQQVLFTYDYWNISQWSGSVPQENLFRKINHLDTWKTYDIKSVTIESTYTSAITNPHLWVASQYAKNYEDKTIEELYTDYFHHSFKDVSSELRQFYDLFSKWNGVESLCKASYLLEVASSKTEFEQVNERLSELKLYLRFISLFYQTKELKDKGLKWSNKTKEYEQWAKDINHTGILHTWAVHAYNYNKIKPWNYKKSPIEYQENNKVKSSTQLISAYQNEQFFEECAPQKLDYQEFSYDLSKFSASQPYTVKPYRRNEEIFLVSPIRQQLNIEVVNPSVDAKIEIKGENGYYNCYEHQTGNFIISDYIEPNIEYEIWFGNKESVKEIRFNSTNVFFYHKGQTTSQVNGYKLNTFYLYIPERLEVLKMKGFEKKEKNRSVNIFFKDTSLNDYKIASHSDGAQTTFTLPTHTNSFDIRGKVIQIQNWTYNFEVLNFNPILSRQAFTVNDY